MHSYFHELILLWTSAFVVSASSVDDIVSSLKCDTTSPTLSTLRPATDSIVRSRARIVPPQLSDDALGQEIDDSIVSASELRNEHHRNPKKDRSSPSHSNLATHLDAPNTGTHPSIQQRNPDLKSLCRKTGTTIAGCVINSREGPFVILAADTRATNGNMVADKTCSKIHPLASNCWCCGAGTSGDLEKITKQVLFSMSRRELYQSTVGNGDIVGDWNHRRTSKQTPMTTNNVLHHHQGYVSGDGDDNEGKPLIFLQPVSIPAICNTFQDILFPNQGNLGANLILGGVWQGRGYLRAIHPHGSIDVGLPFAALGSGGLAAMAVLEEGYQDNLSIEDALVLVQRAIVTGIRNDLGSGSQVDMCVISPDGSSRHTRRVVPEELLEDLPFSNESMTKQQADFSAPSNGVNGFGNTPFAIESTRQRIVNIKSDKERQKSKWNEALGL